MRYLSSFVGATILTVSGIASIHSQVITNSRSPAEFEEVQGVVICWFEEQYLTIFALVEEYGWTPILLEQYQGLMNTQTTLVQEALNEGVEVYVMDDTSHNQVWGKYYSDYLVPDTLAALGINSPLLRVVPEKGQNSPWSRDWGPFSIYKEGADSLYLAGRPFNQLIADYISRPFYQTTIMDGGNYLTDGFGNLFCDAKQPDIDLVTFGITDSVRVADYKVHIDYYLKLINEETFIVNEIPFSNYRPPFDYFFGDSAVLDSVVERLSQRISCYGRPYKFIRIKTAPTLDSNNVTVFTSEASYANSLILNRTVLVPQYQYSVQTDTAALNLYKKLMPGYRVVGIPAWHFAGMGGTIHCITREIASDEPVFVSHAWYPDTVNQTSGYPVEAVIRTRSGVANAAVYWTTDTTLGFQAIAMTNPGGDTFTASVPGQAYGTRVYYYIQAAANSSKVGKKPLVAPSWAYNFLVLEPGACVAKPGDANASGTYTLGDVISGVNYIFNKPGCVPTPLCWLSGLLCRGDWNASGTVTLGDVIQAVNFIFNKPGGPWNALAVGVCCLP